MMKHTINYSRTDNVISYLTIVCLLLACILLPQEMQARAKKTEYTGYLFVYFEGKGEGRLQEHFRFAISTDAVNWKSLNRNMPIIASDTISKSGGIRDPHILRGEDGKTFYIVATDMNTVKYGWGTNPGIVLMKSTDLIHWQHSYIELAKAFSNILKILIGYGLHKPYMTHKTRNI